MAGKSYLHGDLKQYGEALQPQSIYERKKNIQRMKAQPGEVSGGGAKKGYETVSCPHCGAEKDVYYKPGKKITCSACGKEFEI